MSDKIYLKRKLTEVDVLFTNTYISLLSENKSIDDVKKQIKFAISFFKKLKRKSGIKFYSVSQISTIRKSVLYSKSKTQCLEIFQEFHNIVKKMLENVS